MQTQQDIDNIQRGAIIETLRRDELEYQLEDLRRLVTVFDDNNKWMDMKCFLRYHTWIIGSLDENRF